MVSPRLWHAPSFLLLAVLAVCADGRVAAGNDREQLMEQVLLRLDESGTQGAKDFMGELIDVGARADGSGDDSTTTIEPESTKAPTTTIEPESTKAPTTTIEPESTKAPEVMSSTNPSGSGIMSSTKAPEVITSTKAPEVITSTKAPEVITSTKEPEVIITSTKAPEIITYPPEPQDDSLAIAAIVIGSVAIAVSLAAIGAVVYFMMKAKTAASLISNASVLPMTTTGKL